jgi:autotransporter adhesin
VQTLYASVKGNAKAKKWEWVGKHVGDFWDSIGNVNEINKKNLITYKKQNKTKQNESRPRKPWFARQ